MIIAVNRSQSDFLKNKKYFDVLKNPVLYENDENEGQLIFKQDGIHFLEKNGKDLCFNPSKKTMIDWSSGKLKLTQSK